MVEKRPDIMCIPSVTLTVFHMSLFSIPDIRCTPFPNMQRVCPAIMCVISSFTCSNTIYRLYLRCAGTRTHTHTHTPCISPTSEFCVSHLLRGMVAMVTFFGMWHACNGGGVSSALYWSEADVNSTGEFPTK